jgi:hypothetical protein
MGGGGWGERIWTLEYRRLLDFIWKDQPDSYELRQFQPWMGTSLPGLYWSQNQVFRYMSHTSQKSAFDRNVRTMVVWKCSRNSILVGLPGWCDLYIFKDSIQVREQLLVCSKVDTCSKWFRVPSFWPQPHELLDFPKHLPIILLVTWGQTSGQKCTISYFSSLVPKLLGCDFKSKGDI